MNPDQSQLTNIKYNATELQKLCRNMEIRLACVEDGLENMGFRKFAGYVKSIYPETKITYVPTGNLRSVIRVLTEKGGVNYHIRICIKLLNFWLMVTLLVYHR